MFLACLTFTTFVFQVQGFIKNPSRLTCLRHVVLKIDICGFSENVAGIIRLAYLLELAPVLEELVLHVSDLKFFCRNPLKPVLLILFFLFILLHKEDKIHLAHLGIFF